MFKKTSRNLKEIVIVYKTHFDIGYSALAKEVVQKYRTEMIDHTLEIIEKYNDFPSNQQFVWTIPGWPMRQMLWEGQTNDRKKKIQDALKKGNLTIHALPFSTHLATMDLEEMVLGMNFSTQLAKEFGFDLPRGAKTTDVPEQSWILPTLLKKSGVNFYHMGVNDATAMPAVPLLFWWEGPDGSRVLTMATNSYGTWKDPPKDWKLSTWIAILQTGDNEGPPSPDALLRDLAYFKKKYPKTKIKIGRLEDFYNAIPKEELDSLPVIRGDMPDSWIHGVASNPESSKWISDARPLIRYAQFFSTLGSLWLNQNLDLKKEIAQVYENSILWSEHTWGVASQNHVVFDYQKNGEITRAIPIPKKSGVDAITLMQNSWDEHANYAACIKNLLQPVVAQLLQTITSNVAMNGEKIVVFNALAWSRSDYIAIEGIANPNTIELKDLNENVVEYNIINEKLVFYTENIPAMGYKTYQINRVQTKNPKIQLSNLNVDPQNNLIETPWYKAQFDPISGNLVLLIEKSKNIDLIDKSAEFGFGLFNERYSQKDALQYADGVLNPGWVKQPHGDMHCRAKIAKNQNHITRFLKNVKIDYHPLEDMILVKISGEIELIEKRPVEIIYSFYTKANWIDIHIKTDQKTVIDAWPMATWFSLPIQINSPQFRVGQSGYIANPQTDYIKNTSRTSYWIKEGVTIYNSQMGVGISAKDTQLMSLGIPGLMKYDGNYIPKKSHVYINLINNIWHTNFCDWWTGSVEANIRLWCFSSYNDSSSLVLPVQNFRYPLIAMYGKDEGGKLAKERNGIRINELGVLITAYERRDNGYIIRFWNMNRDSKNIAFQIPEEINSPSYEILNLREERESSNTIEKQFINLEIEGFSPLTVLLKK